MVIDIKKHSKEKVKIYRSYRIHSARYLPNLEDGHKCKTMHGHTFNITIYLDGPINDKTGFVMDFFDIDKVVEKEIINKIDHKVLNDIEGLKNPSSENLTIFIWNILASKIDYLSKVTVSEDHGTGIEYSGK